MKQKSVDNLVFFGTILTLVYQYGLLYWSVINGSWQNFLIISGAYVLGMFLGRTTYIILGSILSFISVSAGVLMLLMPYTRDLYFWSGIALMTITPITTYFMYLLDHRLLKRVAQSAQLERFKRARPNRELITGALNQRALERTLTRELRVIFEHEASYQFTLTMVKIDFLESVINFLGHDRFNDLLRDTARRIEEMVFMVDRLYYVGEGKFVLMTPMVGRANTQIIKTKIKSHIDDIAEDFGLTRNALVLRIGQVTYTIQDQVAAHNVAETLAQLERNAETDIVKEYL